MANFSALSKISFVRTYYALGVVPTQTVLALILAVILNQRWLKARGFFRTAFYFPSITSSVVISIIFMWMFTRGGLVNTAIQGIFHNYEFVNCANAWQIFRRITVTIFFVVTLGLIGTFQVFDQIFVISSGGPAKTTLTIAYMVYVNGFDRSAMGLAAATAIVLFVIIFAFTLLQRRVVGERAEI